MGSKESDGTLLGANVCGVLSDVIHQAVDILIKEKVEVKLTPKDLEDVGDFLGVESVTVNTQQDALSNSNKNNDDGNVVLKTQNTVNSNQAVSGSVLKSDIVSIMVACCAAVESLLISHHRHR